MSDVERKIITFIERAKIIAGDDASQSDLFAVAQMIQNEENTNRIERKLGDLEYVLNGIESNTST